MTAPDHDREDAARLAELVAARICHDLVSPVGAIGNGLEMVQELAPDAFGDDLDLIEQGARRAASLLQFHRLAFGPARPDGAPVAAADLTGRLTAVLATPRLQVRIEGGADAAIPRAEARMIALMALAAARLAGRGGVLTLTLDPARIEAVALSEDARWSAVQAALIDGADGADPAPREIEFATLPAAAAAAGFRLERQESPGRAALCAYRVSSAER